MVDTPAPPMGRHKGENLETLLGLEGLQLIFDPPEFVGEHRICLRAGQPQGQVFLRVPPRGQGLRPRKRRRESVMITLGSHGQSILREMRSMVANTGNRVSRARSSGVLMV
jgi:hypothetical protein